MQHKVAFYQGLHYLLRYEQYLGTEIHHFIEILTGTKIQMNNSILIVLICMGINPSKWKGLLTVDSLIAFIEEFLEKNQQATKVLEEMKKYYVLILLGYQSIHDKFEPAHEIFILIAYTLSHPLYMHAQLFSVVRLNP